MSVAIPPAGRTREVEEGLGAAARREERRADPGNHAEKFAMGVPGLSMTLKKWGHCPK